MTRIRDIAILGSTPAAYAAAYFLARQKCDVIVVKCPSLPTECPLTDWAPRELFQAPHLPKSLVELAKAEEFKTVIYFSSRLDKQAETTSRAVSGYFVSVPVLTAVLKKEAAKAGAAMLSLDLRPTILLAEDQVTLVGPGVTSKLLLNVNGSPSEALAALSQPGRTAPQSILTVAGLDVPVTRKAPATRLHALHVVELPERTELGMFFIMGNMAHLRVVSSSKASGTRAAELSTMLKTLQEGGLLGQLALGKAKGGVWYPPAGAALELEAHVAKRCLLAGTAGGFADSITGQTLAPTVQSALLAAQVALAALKNDKTQEALMHFKTSWRQAMADSLRPPSTSLQMLLPLLFVNKRILPKFTRTLMRGESI